MKLKIIGLIFLVITLYSCASKSAVIPTPPETPPTDSKAMVMTADLAEGKVAYDNSYHKRSDPKDFSKEDWAQF